MISLTPDIARTPPTTPMDMDEEVNDAEVAVVAKGQRSVIEESIANSESDAECKNVTRPRLSLFAMLVTIINK